MTHKILKKRLIALSMVVLTVIVSAVHIAVYTTTKDIIEEEFRRSAQGLAVSISYNLMENIGEYKEFLATRDVHSEYYRQMQEHFAYIKSQSNVKYIYTERKLDAKTSEFILDAEPIGSPDYSPPGSTDPNDPEKEVVYSTGRPFGFGLINYEKWGPLMGAYAPIFDDGGEMLGIAGVNFDGAYLTAYLNRLQVVLLAIYALIYALSLAVLLKYTDTVLALITTDKLTGAGNRRSFEQFAPRQVEAAVRQKQEVALMMLDLDHFKRINDSYGHSFGDKVLSEVSQIVRSRLREGDHFFRYGGEEFVVMITNLSMQHVPNIAERIRKAVAEAKIFNEEHNIPVSVTISIGIAGLSQSTTGLKELLDNADKALYAAKNERNRVAVWQPALGAG